MRNTSKTYSTALIPTHLFSNSNIIQTRCQLIKIQPESARASEPCASDIALGEMYESKLILILSGVKIGSNRKYIYGGNVKMAVCMARFCHCNRLHGCFLA